MTDGTRICCIIREEEKNFDIVILRQDQTTTPFNGGTKKPKLKDGKEQLHSYCNASGTP